MLGLGSLSEAARSAIRNTTHSNLLSNPHFATNATSWNAFNWSLARSTTDVTDGSFTAQLTSTGGVGGMYQDYLGGFAPAAVPGQWFTWSLDLKNETVTAASFDVRIEYFTAANASLGSSWATWSVSTGSAWTRVYYSSVAPATAAKVVGEVYANGLAGETFRVTKLMLDANETRVPYMGPLYYDGSLFTTVSLASTGTASSGGVTGDATLTETVTLASTGTVGKSGGASLTETVTLTAAGGGAGGGSLTATVALSATGTAGRIGNASLTETVSLTATGAAGKNAGASRTVSVALTAAGSTGVASGASLAVSVSRTADGTIPPLTADSSLTITLALSSSGTVVAPRILFSPPSTIERENRRSTGGLWWVPSTGGYTAFRRDGQWHVQENPAAYDLTGADLVYLGGRTYEVTPDERDVLITAGFGSGIYYET